MSGHPNDFKISHGPESGFNSFGIRNRVVHEGETRGLSTTELGLESENDDVVGGRLNLRKKGKSGRFVYLVLLGESFSDLRLLGSRGFRVKDVNNHLLSVKKAVGHELSSSHGDGGHF